MLTLYLTFHQSGYLLSLPFLLSIDQDCYEKIDVGHYYGDLGIVFFRGGRGGQMSTSCCTTFTHNQGGNTIHLLFQVSWLNERSLTWL